MTALRTRPPTGAVPWPLVLVEGPEKSGKSYQAALFTASNRIGQAYWIDLGEGAADEYAAIPGANYLVVEHDGTWRDILGQVEAIRDQGLKAQAAGKPPVVLVIDSMTAEWDMLKAWTNHRAVESTAGKKALERDPNAEVKATPNLWNDANDRHGKLMHLLMTFPGVVVVTARGKEVMSLDDKGRPIPNQKDYRVEGHKGLAFDATAWVRLSRDSDPLVVGVRSLFADAAVRPGEKVKPWPEFSIEALVFDQMRCDPSKARTRDLQQTVAADEPSWFANTPEVIAKADADRLAKAREKLEDPELAQFPETARLLELVADREAVLAGAVPSDAEAQQTLETELGGTEVPQ